MLQVRGVTKAYGSVVALAGVDLEVAAGEIVGLVGPNGAGKTSLVSIVAGLRRPDTGQVFVDGLDVSVDSGAVSDRIGLAPQELAIYPNLRVRENLTLYGELAGLRRKQLSTRIADIADSLGLAHLIERPAAALSGGEKRRLHTAMALVHRPKLLLLDEPTTGADVESRGQLLELVRELARGGAAICYSTHYLPEVETLGASVAILDRGRVIARGSVRDLVAEHAMAGVELLFDGPAPALARADVVIEGSRLRVNSADPAQTAAQVLVSLPPEATARLQSVEILHPTLESVYLAVAGRRYGQDEPTESTETTNTNGSDWSVGDPEGRGPDGRGPTKWGGAQSGKGSAPGQDPPTDRGRARETPVVP